MDKQRKKKSNQKDKIVWIIAIIAIVISAVVVTVVTIYFQGRYKKNETDSETSYEMDDADTFFRKNATVISVTPAEDSQLVYMEEEIEKEFKKRGFDQYEITSSYDMQGTYSENNVITEAGTDKHPMYETYYQTDDGKLWTIMVVNGDYLAYPVFYNIEASVSEVVFSENGQKLTAYDSETNQFYELEPKKEVTVVAWLEKIDAQHLNAITEKDIDKYVK